MNGETPTSGSITIESGKVTDIAFTYTNGKTIIKNDEGKLAFAGGKTPVVEPKTFKEICKYVSGTEKTAGAKYSCEVKEGTSYNFYVLTTPTEGSETINLIMDRNICEDGTPATAENTCLVAYNLSGDAAGVGPVTAMTYLNNATSSWENIDNLDITYDDEWTNFTGFVLNGKARLPYKSEVANSNGSNEYLYENLDVKYWNGSGTQPTNNISGIYGYWTLSSGAASSTGAWFVSFGGSVYDTGVDGFTVDDDDSYGVRAVITLKL